MIQALARRLILILVLELYISDCPTSFGQGDSTVLANQEVIALYKEGKYREAIPIAEKLLAIRRNAVVQDNTDTAESLNNLALLYRAIGEYAKAEPLFQQLLRITEKLFGPKDSATVTSLNNLALLYSDMGYYAKAEALFQQSLQITKRALGLEHPDTAASLDNLANLYDTMGYYVKAEPLFKQALQIRKRVLGPENADTAMSFDNLGQLYFHTGDYAKAEPLCQQALEVRERVLGPENSDTSISLNHMAEIYFEKSDYAKAELLFQQALQIKKKVLGLENTDTAITLNDLAVLYEETGDYAKAEALFQQALQICTKVLGTQNVDTARSLNNLGSLYNTIGDFTKAEPLFRQALEITTTILGSERPYTVTCLNNLGLVYREMGDYAKAESFFQQALHIRKKVLGPKHPNTARSLHNLASLYFQMSDYAKAESLYQQALRIYQNALGPEHPDTAICLNDLAQLYQTMGKYASAEALLQKALQIDKKVLGPEHLYTAVDLDNLGFLDIDRKQFGKVRSIAQLSAKAHLALLAKILSFASERQRLAYQDSIDPYSFLVLLKGNEVDLALAILRYKGVVLDSLIEDRLVAEASKDSADRELLVQLAANKRRLGQLLLDTPNAPSSEINKEIKTLENVVETLEGQLARHISVIGSARRALSVSVEQVQAAIPKDGALIEYLRYRRYIGKNKWEQRYGAMVLSSTCSPNWIPLGSAEDIDAIVIRYQRLMRAASDEQELTASLEALYAELWAPIEKSLPAELRRVIISPDGQLNFVSFTTLLDSDERFLAERFTVQYTASGRDLLPDVTPQIDKVAVLFANPDFNLASSQTFAAASTAFTTTPSPQIGTAEVPLESSSFNQLEGTQNECDRLKMAFEEWHWKVNYFANKDATKQALLQVHSPQILHLATHGFFESGDQYATKSIPQSQVGLKSSLLTSKFFNNPMHRSGLALAGANVTLEAWKRGDAPPVESDGVVTAEDVAALDLKSTWLVTLSACDTASGEVKAGEGVLGLRRGFMQAGAINLLMSLWPINDQTTIHIMTDFYNTARKTANAPQSLSDVQRDWLVRLRKEHGLARAVRVAGPFIMSSQGKP